MLEWKGIIQCLGQFFAEPGDSTAVKLREEKQVMSVCLWKASCSVQATISPVMTAKKIEVHNFDVEGGLFLI